MTCPRSGPCKWSWDLNSGQTEPRHPVRPLCEPCEGAGGLRARSEEGLLEDGMPALDFEGRAETRLHEFDIAWNRGKWPGWPEGRRRAEQSQRGSDLPSSTSSSHSTASDPGADPPHACPDSLVASERPRGLASPPPSHLYTQNSGILIALLRFFNHHHQITAQCTMKLLDVWSLF